MDDSITPDATTKDDNDKEIKETISEITISDETRADALYYKWRVYSFIQGDSFCGWRSEPFQLVDD